MSNLGFLTECLGRHVGDTPGEFVFSELPEEEKEIVINEIYERWKDVVYMNAKQHIREIFEEPKAFSVLSTDDEIKVSLYLHLCVGDIIQVLGRYRRGKKRS